MMQKNQDRFRFLFDKYTTGTASAKERNSFLEMVSDGHYTDLLKALIRDEVESTAPNHKLDTKRAEEIFDKIIHDNPTNHELHVSSGNNQKRHFIWLAAAVLTGIAIWGGFRVAQSDSEQIIEQHVSIPIEHDVAPGRSGAILTLSDGSTIVLDTVKNGWLTSQDHTDIVKQDARIDYTARQRRESKLLYNTLTTPKGRQFQLVLSDGSRVWLNAASSITFPATFLPGERKVKITGEVYFEIKPHLAADGHKVPFNVTIGSEPGVSREIDVLGTYFNVNAYQDEPLVRTTLVAGSVRLKENNHTVTIRPGEQAIMYGSAKKMSVIPDADIEEAIAWKDGFFTFKNATISEIMRQVERWYDVNVEYPDGVPAGHYAGDVSMNVNASEMLNVLQVGGIRFRIEGKRIIIQ